MYAFRHLLPEGDMRDENEKRILKAIQENDIESMKEISNVVDCRLGPEDVPILSAAVLKGDIDMIKYLVDSGCDVRKVDKYGRTAWYVLSLQGSSDAEKNRLRIADIFLTSYSNAAEAIFLTGTHYQMSPFLMACQQGFDAVVLHFLHLIDRDSISMDHLISDRDVNAFHYLFEILHPVSPMRLESLRALMDKFPNFIRLIDAKNHFGQTPLHKLLMFYRNENRVVVDLANLFFKRGASPDLQDGYGATYLDRAIETGNVSLIEILLRVRCRTDVLCGIYKVSPLRFLLKNKPTNFISIIERLLAFGYDLQKELFLYTIDERPIEFTSPEYVERCDTSDMDPDILQQLQELRRSNKMLSLQRQCRNTIRRHLKAKADEVIGSLTCIPDRIKSYLLVKNEESLLEIRE